MAFSRRLLAETGVAVAPGIDFDVVHGNRFVRMCYAGATEDLHAALGRLGGWLPGLAGA
jgi:aspartate/methionine/tyrosine aminotransferase